MKKKRVRIKDMIYFYFPHNRVRRFSKKKKDVEFGQRLAVVD